MKRILFTIALALTATAISAQNYIVVNSEKVFKSISAYNNAITELDKLATQYQEFIDSKYQQVEQLYNTYQSEKANLNAAARQAFENEILQKEQQANEDQERLFGEDGALMKKRIELIQPIQERVFQAIERYAKQVGADVVIDSSNNPTLLYNSTAVERTKEVIKLLQ
ncbi:MAG: OmpH family outer membrane protein [Alistipes sp.]|nr:OmpH family outer membrane protein [Alistipes sp.]